METIAQCDSVLRKKMNEGTPVIGTFAHLGGPVTIECLGLAGLDFVVIVTEHGPFDYSDAIEMVRAAEIVNLAPIIRVCDHTRPSLHKALNTGCAGLIIPCIRTLDEIYDMPEEARYYPKGRHCFPYARNSMWNTKIAAEGLEQYFARANKETLIIPQCETVGFLENAETIMAMPEIDGLFVGPYDLSTDMGIPAQFDHPDFLAARKRLLKACSDNNKFAWAFCPNPETAKKNQADGFKGSAICMDTGVYTSAYKQMVEKMRS